VVLLYDFEKNKALLKPCGVIKKKREIRIREGVSPPPCPTPIKIFFGQGFGEGTLNSEYY